MGLLSFFLGGGCESLSPQEVKEMKSRSENFVLLDVRTPQETAGRKIQGAKLIPLQELNARATEIPKEKDVVVYCQNGVRSIFACKMLKQLGYRVKNMTGGISRW